MPSKIWLSGRVVNISYRQSAKDLHCNIEVDVSRYMREMTIVKCNGSGEVAKYCKENIIDQDIVFIDAEFNHPESYNYGRSVIKINEINKVIII